MSKCQGCKQEGAEWAWQPFGPGEKATFCFLGSHYRGFPVIKVGDKCKESIEAGRYSFEYRGEAYIVQDGEAIWSPF